MKTHCIRMRRGDDILTTLQTQLENRNIHAAVLLGAVGCVREACIRSADGVTVHHISEPMEIVSLSGTLSKERCHLHVAFSKADLSVIGGHLKSGCIVNTTLELVLLELEDVRFSKEFDPDTGYHELSIEPR